MNFCFPVTIRGHENTDFITLTYSPENIQCADDIDYDTGVVRGTYPVLVKEDFQKFMKRLRKAQSQVTDDKMKYYAVGEYGSKTKRPHYHAILFGRHPEVKVEDSWNLGLVDVGEVNLDSIDYITKYVVNKKDFKHYIVPPFSLVSNGIGLDHLERNFERYKDADFVRGARGFNQVVPRYYRNRS